MKANLRCLGLAVHATWQDLAMEQLHRLKGLTDIESAEVILERQRNSTPAFRAHIVLVVPGPDYHADAVDHTLAAALRKAVEKLKRQIQVRQTKRWVKGKSNLQIGPISRHWFSAHADHPS